ncbi:hypothetical protein OPU39_06290, partial [Acinetobacter nosocomialis]|nr:hypothetical protein [Acinetobacter nosocomialis]
MSKPDNVFQQSGKHIKTGNLTFLTTQVAQWQRLTKIIQPLLPRHGSELQKLKNAKVTEY